MLGRNIQRALLGAGLGATLIGGALAQAGTEGARFAPPVRLSAGERYLGEGRYYPSPALHDLDGDGVQDVVIGDLMGRPTYALRGRAEDGIRLAPEQKLEGASGEPLNFHNW